MSSTFIVGCARSGTTSLLKALGLSNQAYCLVEPMPNLNIESREMLKGRLSDPYEPLARHIAPRVAKGLSKRRHYIEKQVALLPFMKQLRQLFGCRFIIPIRDGRLVVRSLINWHNHMFPVIYQECRERGDLSARAEQALARQVGIDPYDYSLPRPPRNDPWHQLWNQFTRFEMATWYWAFINQFALDQAKELDPADVLIVDYTRPTKDTIRHVYDFVGLTDFNEDAVESLLNKRVNSLEDRIQVSGSFPSWPDWTILQKQRFSEIAHDTMHLLGMEPNSIRPKPPGFGEWWIEQETNIEWYKEIYEYRAPLHEVFKGWFKNIDASTIGPLESIADVGCGIGHGYLEFFQDKRYIGIDLSPGLIDYCNTNNKYSKHSFHSCDIIQETPDCKVDLTFSQGTIDNVYDLDAFLRAMARMTSKVLYVVNYRGYFNGLSGHRYCWDQKTRVCFNDISPRRVAQVLQEEGFKTVLVFPQKTQRADIASETVIIACREMTDPQALMAGHTIHGCFAPYQVVSSKLTLNEVLQIVNQGCFYFSDDGLGLANDLGYFRAISAAIVEAKNLRPGTVEQLATGVKGVNLAIRTDVDMDLPAAAKMAKIAGGQGLPITFYLLHTAGYYGHFQGGVFSRNEANSQLYREMQTQGAEIALHIDPYSIYLDHGIDGAQAVKTELAWLRSCGLRIAGTSAHNAAPVYGAENFEIFKGRSIRQGGWFHRNYVYLPLGVLDEAELGLRYEACSARPAGEVHQLHDEHPYVARLPEGDFLRDYQWLRTYLLNNPYCRWAYTYHVWLVGKDLWAIAGRPENGPPLFLYPVGWSRVNDFLHGVGGNEKVLITLHPIYLGRRNRAGAEPEDLGALRSAA